MQTDPAFSYHNNHHFMYRSNTNVKRCLSKWLLFYKRKEILILIFYVMKIWSVGVLVIVGMVRYRSTPRMTVTLVELGVISSSHQTVASRRVLTDTGKQI